MNLHFSDEIKKAITIRLVEEKLLNLFALGELNGTVHTAVGQEFTGVFISKFLTKEDFVTSNHRGHGHYLARFGNIRGLIAEIMGKETGLSGGYGGSQHIVDYNYLSNGIQGGMLPIAAGVSHYFKSNHLNNISVSYIGDGTLGQGIVYETLNLVSVYESPLLIVIENNGYAQSTSIKQSFRGDLKKRAEGFGIQYFKSSTFDLHDLNTNCEKAISFVRNKKMPALIEIETYRLNSHSKGDDNRNKNEVEKFRKKDILSNYISLNNEDLNLFINSTNIYLDDLISEIKKDPNLIKTKKSLKLSSLPEIKNTSKEITSNDRYNALIYNSLKFLLSENEKMILIGEDVQNKSKFTDLEYGGAFKVTRNLSDLFPERILNSPISEASIVGFVSGYSIKAGRSIVEIMFGDFTTLIFDQILQHAAKFEQMFNGKIKCPLIIRTPMGGKRGYGPTHSQSLEKHFLGIDNFGVIVLNHRISPEYIYRAIMTISMPLMVIENKILYTIETTKNKLPLYDYKFNNSLFSDLLITPRENLSSITILCYGETLNVVEDVALSLLIDEEIFCDIICPTLISEINILEIKNSLSNTKNLLIIEEGAGFASWGSEIVSKLHENNFTSFKFSKIYNNALIPSSYKAELELLPNSTNIKNKIIELI